LTRNRVVAFSAFVARCGAIKGWDRRNQFYFIMLQSLACITVSILDLPFESAAEYSGHFCFMASGKMSSSSNIR